MDSVVVQTEKWSPYQNLVVFSSTVLLWQRPVIFALVAIFTHIFLWYTTVALFKWNTWFVVGAILCTIFICDFLFSSLHFTTERFLALFPHDGTERVSYTEIVQQYVSFRRFCREQFNRAMAFRNEQHQQFLITSLFFTIVICFILSFVNLFTLIYFLVFAGILAPGLWHNDIPRRVYIFVGPHVSASYQFVNDKMTEILSPNPNPNPSNATVVNRDFPGNSPQSSPSPAYAQRPSRPVSSRYSPSSSPLRPSSATLRPSSGSPRPVSSNFTGTSYATIPGSSPPSYLSNMQPRKRQQ